MAKQVKKTITSLEDLGSALENTLETDVFTTDEHEVRDEFVEYSDIIETTTFDDFIEVENEDDVIREELAKFEGAELGDDVTVENTVTEEIEEDVSTENSSTKKVLRLEKCYDFENDEFVYKNIYEEVYEENENMTYDDASEKERREIIDELVDASSTDEVSEIPTTDELTRENLISELEKMYSLIHLPYVRETWEHLSTQRLYDLLDIVKKDNGGSMEVATLIRQTVDDYNNYLNSETMKSRLRFIDQKGSDYAKVAERLSRMIGSDVVISGIKVKDYHELLKNHTKVLVSIFQKINEIAEYCNIDIPVDLNFPNGTKIPVLKDMPLDTEVAMYVLNVLKASINRVVFHTQIVKEELPKKEAHIDFLKGQLKASKINYDSAIKEAETIRLEAKRMVGDSSYWIIKDTHGNILRKINPEKALETPYDLDLRGTIDTALFLTTARSAEILVERLTHSRRFKKRVLNSYRVSIVQQTHFEEVLEDDTEDTETVEETSNSDGYVIEEMDDTLEELD